MRDIRFRAWDIGMKQMIHDALEIKNIGLGKGSVIANTRAQEGQELEWMQFTGLLDKSGKEIYEGDILKVWNPEKPEEVLISSVIWAERHAHWKAEEAHMTLYRFIQDNHGDMCEIIGNIYENKALLTNK